MAAWLDNMGSNLLGYDPAQLKGLLEEADLAKARQSTLLGLSQGLLSASGPSRMPINFGQAFAQATAQGQQAGQGTIQQAMMARQIRAQQEAAKRPQYTNVPGVGLVKIPNEGDPSIAIQAQQSSEAPMSVKEWEYYNRLPEHQKPLYLEMKRAAQVLNVGGVPGTLAPGQQFKPLSSLPAEAAAKGEIAGAEASAKSNIESSAAQVLKNKERADALAVYEASRNGLVGGLKGAMTGPVAGRVPAVTTAAQIADGAQAAMVPALKGIFRTAGEGTFTDRDQQMLIDMVPTRKDTVEAAKAKMDNIDNIVRAKLGGAPAGAPQPGHTEGGYRFRGGNAADPANWEKI